MTALSVAFGSVAHRIERLQALDRTIDVVASAVRAMVPPSRARDVANGVPLGHPAHPSLVALPIGAFAGAGFLDLLRPRTGRKSARSLIGLGLASAVPTVYAGLSDWVYTEGAERRVGFVHAITNDAALACYGASWLARRRGRGGMLLAGAGAALLACGGWLGGHLSYALGVGVDTTVFQRFPTEWTDVLAADDVQRGHAARADIGDVSIVVMRTGRGLSAMADRCTHRGGPLNEGKIDEGCIVCPWHGSRFDLHDGSVRNGPASRPQPVLQVRERDGRVEVKRPDDSHTLRNNPV